MNYETVPRDLKEKLCIVLYCIVLYCIAIVSYHSGDKDHIYTLLIKEVPLHAPIT